MPKQQPKKIEILPPINDLIDKDAFRRHVESRLGAGTRSKLNEELFAYLVESNEFLEGLQKLRSELDIPFLKLKDDLTPGYRDILDSDNSDNFKTVDFVESYYLEHEVSKEKRKDIIEKIEIFSRKYGLPRGFYGWVQDYLLYNEKPHYNPTYDWELAEFAVKNSQKIPLLNLTTKEKKYIKETFRLLARMKPGRPQKHLQKAYKYFCNLLIKSKNRNRRSRVWKNALVIEKEIEGGYYDPAFGGEAGLLVERSYEQIAEDISEEIGGEVPVNRLRQRKHAIKKRRGNILNKEK